MNKKILLCLLTMSVLTTSCGNTSEKKNLNPILKHQQTRV